MKRTLLLTTIVCFFGFAGKAQENTANTPCLIHTLYINSTVENAGVNLDSLLKIYKHLLLDPNQYITGTKILKHWYGHDSREVLIITEYKSWEDIEKADARQAEIMMAIPKTKELIEGRSLWFSFIFPEHHSDEIYSTVAE